MRLLLDTHVFLWTQSETKRLGEHLRLLQDSDTTLFLSVASAWEIAIKYQLGRLTLPDSPDRYVPERMRLIDARSVAIEQAHSLAVAQIPRLHRDPFDRMLVAQALLLDLTIMTADRTLARYDVPTMLVG